MADQYIPLIAYSSTTDTSDDQRGGTRYWGMFWYRDIEEPEKLSTVEMMVVTDVMPDFCGGIIVHSPRVNIRHSSDSWDNRFADPGGSSDTRATWGSFDPDKHAVDVAKYTGKDRWSASSAREYGYKCIAASIAGSMLAGGKRGIMMADHVDGRATTLAGVMSNMGTFLASPFYNMRISRLAQNSSITLPCGSERVAACSFDYEVSTSYHNPNSGNNVHWVTATLTAEQDESVAECPNCGEEVEGEYGYCSSCDYEYGDGDCNVVYYAWHWKELEALSTSEYSRNALRYYWRNG